MNARTRAAAGIAAAATSLLLTACGGGGVGVPGVSVGPSGEVSISSSEGSIEFGGAKIPEGYPSEVLQPEGFTVESAAKMASDGQQNFVVTYGAEGDQSAAVTKYVAAMKAAGFTVDSEYSGDSGGSMGGVYELSNATWKVGVISSVDSGKTSLIINVTPADA